MQLLNRFLPYSNCWNVTFNSDIKHSMHYKGVQNVAIHEVAVHEVAVHEVAVHEVAVHEVGVHDMYVHDMGLHSTGVHGMYVPILRPFKKKTPFFPVVCH
jgi:hypothetical protein